MASPVRLEEFEEAEPYQTQDPEVVIVEVRAKATLTTTGRSFVTMSIQIYRIREGQIVLFRDFANPRVLEDVISEPRPAAAAGQEPAGQSQPPGRKPEGERCSRA
jgi:ketosteroid isomerase-like protein